MNVRIMASAALKLMGVYWFVIGILQAKSIILSYFLTQYSTGTSPEWQYLLINFLNVGIMLAIALALIKKRTD